MPTTNLEFTLTRDDDSTKLTIIGEIDLNNRDSLISAGISALDDTSERLEIDVSGVTFCDSSGLSGFIAIRRIADGVGKAAVLTNPSRQLASVLSMTGLEPLLTAPGPNAETDES